MSRRIDIELTSACPDGTWTWRVAGAKQPKGSLDGALLDEGCKVGDVLRAEAEFELEGTIITSVHAAPQKRAEPERLEILGTPRTFEGVTTSLVPKGGRPRDGRGGPREGDRPREARDGRDRRPAGPRPDRAGDRPSVARAAGPRPDRADGPRPDRASGPRPDRASGPRPDRGAGPRPDRPRSGASAAAGSSGSSGSDQAGERQTRAPSGPPKPKRLNPGNTFRAAALAELAPEQQAIAEQLLQGGVPARALQEQNAKLRSDGLPEIKADALIGLAEELLPALKAAEWRDRAEAAAKDLEELNVRDLRSIVAGGDAGARDDESRILAKTLREALERRENAERDAWIGEVTTCLDEGRVTRALRVAGRPPDPRTRFPSELMTRLAEAASAAMAPDVAVDRWTALLAAALESPVRRSVKPLGLPSEPGDALLAAARQAAGRIPALAPLLGLTMPPPPGPPRAASRPGRAFGRPMTVRPRTATPPTPRTAEAAGADRAVVEVPADAPPAADLPAADPPVEPSLVEAAVEPVDEASIESPVEPVADAPMAPVEPAQPVAETPLQVSQAADPPAADPPAAEAASPVAELVVEPSGEDNAPVAPSFP